MAAWEMFCCSWLRYGFQVTNDSENMPAGLPSRCVVGYLPASSMLTARLMHLKVCSVSEHERCSVPNGTNNPFSCLFGSLCFGLSHKQWVSWTYTVYTTVISPSTLNAVRVTEMAMETAIPVQGISTRCLFPSCSFQNPQKSQFLVLEQNCLPFIVD